VRRRLAGRVFLVAALLCGPLAAGAETLTVFAAASLRESLDEVARAFERAHGHRVRVAYGASSALARQIEAGAPAHLFVSADGEWMDHLQSRGLVEGAPTALLSNEMVLVAPAGAAPALRIAPGFPLGAALGTGRLALADPRSVPAGKYARSALQSLGVWRDVETRLAPAENVRVALALVARREAPLGIVYRTDAAAEPGVAIVDRFPAGSHPPIVYPMAVLRGAPPAAAELARFLASGPARAIWRRHGFGLPS
jgi:molybdate transport system substrate-binding protein